MPKRILLPILSAMFYCLSQPPFTFFFLSYVCLVPLFYLMEEEPWKDFLMGIRTGLLTYLGLVYWVVIAMKRYAGINLIVAFFILFLFALYLSLYTGLFCLTISSLKKHFSIPLYFSAPSAFILFEYLRGTLLTGFPWSFLAHSHYNFLPLIQIVSVTGSYFISFLVVAVNVVIFYSIKKGAIPFYFLVGLILVFFVVLGYGIYKLRNDDKLDSFHVTIIQGNVSQDTKWGEMRIRHIIKRYSDLSLKSGGSDLVVWPETALPFIFEERQEEKEIVQNIARKLESYLLFGVFRKQNDRFYNASYLLDKHGDILGIYEKVHLVPFGEYTPFLQYLPFREWIRRHVGELSPGKGHFPLRTEIGNVGVLICYEGIFPYISRKTVKNGAQVLVNLTNDAWYDISSAPYQHLAFYIFRAIETDRFVIRAANTGISAIIDPKGRINARTNLFKEQILNGSFSMKSSMTLYVTYGDYFVFVSTLYLFVVVVIFSISRFLTREF